MAQDAALDAAAEMLGVGKDVLAHSLTHKKARWGGGIACVSVSVRMWCARVHRAWGAFVRALATR